MMMWYRLKQDFPDVFVEINGGITTVDEIKTQFKSCGWRDDWA